MRRRSDANSANKCSKPLIFYLLSKSLRQWQQQPAAAATAAAKRHNKRVDSLFVCLYMYYLYLYVCIYLCLFCSQQLFTNSMTRIECGLFSVRSRCSEIIFH